MDLLYIPNNTIKVCNFNLHYIAFLMLMPHPNNQFFHCSFSQTYEGCSCLSLSGSNTTLTVTGGKCTKDCHYLPFYLLSLLMGMLFSFMAGIPIVSAILRYDGVFLSDFQLPFLVALNQIKQPTNLKNRYLGEETIIESINQLQLNGKLYRGTTWIS